MAVAVLSVGMFMVGALCQEETTAVYIVTLRQAPAALYYSDELSKNRNVFHKGGSLGKLTTMQKPRCRSLLVLCSGANFTLCY